MPGAPATLSPPRSRALVSLFFGLAVMLLCLLGIFSRPGADLASFWPANAFMLGMLIRFRGLATGLSWLCCALGFMLADLVTGASMVKALALNAGNLLAIAVGYLALRRLGLGGGRMAAPAAALYMLVGAAAAALTAGLYGMAADPLLFGGRPMDALVYWSATEMVNYVAFLPLVLTLPDRRDRSARRAAPRRRPIFFAPLLTLALAALLGIWIGGPGALAFPVLALLWCALTYSLFATACLSFLFVAWSLLAINAGYLAVAPLTGDRATLLSIRVAVSLIGVAPLLVASIMAAREELLERFRALSTIDQMTGLLNRASFLADSAAAWPTTGEEVSVLMLDLDRFKQINDTYGHAGGDQVLRDFAAILRDNLRRGDLAGRLGGEEFAVFLPGCPAPEAAAIAARINRRLAAQEIRLTDGRSLHATVSIGLAVSNDRMPGLDRLLARADDALYAAKRGGRDRIVAAPEAA